MIDAIPAPCDTAESASSNRSASGGNASASAPASWAWNAGSCATRPPIPRRSSVVGRAENNAAKASPLARIPPGALP